MSSFCLQLQLGNGLLARLSILLVQNISKCLMHHCAWGVFQQTLCCMGFPKQLAGPAGFAAGNCPGYCYSKVVFSGLWALVGTKVLFLGIWRWAFWLLALRRQAVKVGVSCAERSERRGCAGSFSCLGSSLCQLHPWTMGLLYFPV